MRFGSPRDYAFMLSINKEIINTVIDVNIIIYKMITAETLTNIYGEAVSKVRYVPTQVPCLIDQAQFATENAAGTIDVEQEVNFAFLRRELKDRDIYPEQGDIIFFNHSFYELHRINETNLWAGQTKYNHDIVCDAHLTRKNPLQIDELLHE
jgi:hypothetical protein